MHERLDFYQFIPRSIGRVADFTFDGISKVSCTFKPDNSTFFASFDIENIDVIEDIQTAVNRVLCRPKLPLEILPSVNQNINMTFYKNETDFVTLIFDRPKSVYLLNQEKLYVVYNDEALEEINNLIQLAYQNNNEVR